MFNGYSYPIENVYYAKIKNYKFRAGYVMLTSTYTLVNLQMTTTSH